MEMVAADTSSQIFSEGVETLSLHQLKTILDTEVIQRSPSNAWCEGIVPGKGLV